MKKWLIIYSSNTGNTEQIAFAMRQALDKNENEIHPLKEIPADFPLENYDIIAVGYWLTRGGPDMQVQKLLKKIENKQVVLFQTHGAEKYSEHSITAFARAASCLGSNCSILGTFACQGKINPALLSRRQSLAADDPHAPTERNIKRWENAARHPDDNDLKDAAAFIEAMQKKLALREKYKNSNKI